MQAFKDASGKERMLSLTVGKCKKIKASLGVDFIDPKSTQEAFAELLGKPLLRINLFYHSLENADGISQDDFENLLTGAAFLDASKAFDEELRFFIQSLHPELIPVLDEMKAKMASMVELQNKAIVEISNDPAMNKMVVKQIDKMKQESLEMLGRLSMESPESSDAVQTLTASAN